jgi:Protein of unknown function (DUF1420)
VGNCLSNLVLRAIQTRLATSVQVSAAKIMALIASLGALAGVALFALLFAALGQRMLRWSGISPEDSIEYLLLAEAAGVIVFEVAIAIVSYTGKFRIGIAALTLVLAIVAAPEIPNTFRDLIAVGGRLKFSPVERILAALVFVVLLIDGLSAAAPLTGSDALHYHFTSVRLYLTDGFHPIFSIVHSFLLGQSHQLIVMGLALGSEKLALGLLYLGGVLTAAAAACLARRLSSPVWGWLTALAFLATPIIFWQMTVSGAPDVWMAFFTTMAVLCIARYREQASLPLVFWIGMLGGAVAGAKYSGCIVAAAILLALLREEWKPRPQLVLVAGMLVAGIWPYFRNLLWTRDPFFPFGTRWLAPGRLNSFTLASLIADTGTNEHAGVLRIPLFATFAQFDPRRPGFFQYFGPLCLVFVPLVLLSIRNTSLWRATLIVWLASSVGLAVSSGLTRFFIPVFPIALAASIASASLPRGASIRVLRPLAWITIVIVVMLGLGGLVIYERPALAASVGRISAAEYLRERAPDYERTEFVNANLPSSGPEKALVFFQHLYYLKVPFIYGDPKASWIINPHEFQSPENWMAFFEREHIRWVVRAPSYPPAIAAPLLQLEKSGELVPLTSGETTDFVGMRIQEVRVPLPIVILRVQVENK